jgi:hypothetical protein
LPEIANNARRRPDRGLIHGGINRHA